MKTVILTIVGLAVINIVSGQLLDRPCTQDENCNAKNWVCKAGKCRCGVTFRQGSQQDCIPILGSNCQSSDECENMPGATCEKNVCVCRAGQLVGAKECVKIGVKGEECTESSDCIGRSASGPDVNMECNISNNMCTCKAGFHEGKDERCKANRVLNDVCNVEDDCYQPDSNNDNSLECISVDDVKQCKCKKGYEEQDGQCKNGSATLFVLSATSLLLVVMAILKM